MNKNVLLISNDPTFVFMMAAIIENLSLPLQSSHNDGNVWNLIKNKQPRIVIWDAEHSNAIEEIDHEFHNQLPGDSHLFLFSDAISRLSHLKNRRLHLFPKPFSPKEISCLLREITS
ncbi:MAG: hypothetical protein E3J78_07150 [Candidatus Cloacimonadota bacterium]|nr:MAG: hypothetical protein E3J78_07150 [Candidatus Cloacimonadota bacterium]